MVVEGKANAMDVEQNLEKPVSSEGMLKSFAMTSSFKNRPLQRFQQKLKSQTSQVKARVDKRFFSSNALSEALRQFSRRTFGKRKSMSLAQGGSSKEKGRKWSALAMTLPSGNSGNQANEPTSTSLSSRTFSSGSSIPAFSLPDQGSVFSQFSSTSEQPVSKPKWKPPEPGARRFSRVEEVQASTSRDDSSVLRAVSPDAATVQKSSKPDQPNPSPTSSIAKTDTSAKPARPAARQTVAAAPISKKPESQSPKPDLSTLQNTPGLPRSTQVSEPAPKNFQPPTGQVDNSMPSQPVPGLHTQPATGEDQTAVEPKAEIQMPSPENSQAATQNPNESLPKLQSPAGGKGQPPTPIQEPAQPVRMPLAPRRSLHRANISRQTLIGQHKYRLSHPDPAVKKAAPAIQRKSLQLPLKRPQPTLPQQTPAAVQNLKPSGLPLGHTYAQAETPKPVPAQVQALPAPTLETPSVVAPTKPQPATLPSLPISAKDTPLQRKSFHLPLKRPVLAARKSSAEQTRRLNIAAMPLRQTPAKVGVEKEGIGKKAGLPPAAVKILPTKPTRNSQAVTPGSSLPIGLSTGAPQALAPKADLAYKASSEIAPTSGPGLAHPAGLAPGNFEPSAPKADLPAKLAPKSAQTPASGTNLLSTQPVEASALPNLALPLISKTLMQRISGRRQMVQARPMASWQREPNNLPSARFGLSRVSKLPGQSVQRSPRVPYPVIPTRKVQRPAQSPSESIAGSQGKIPDLSAPPIRFKPAVPSEKPLQTDRPSAEKPSSFPETQAASQMQVQSPKLAPHAVLQARRKAGSTQPLPPTINKNRVLSLTALRKGKPILAPHSENNGSVGARHAEVNHQLKLEVKPAVTGVSPKQPTTPIHPVKSSPVVQRKVSPQEERGRAPSNNLDLPLASQPSGPQPGSASQNQSGFTTSSGRNDPQQMPSQANQSPFSAQRQHSTPTEPPQASSGYVNPFADEPRPEMPVRNPVRPNIFESLSQPDQQSSDQSGALLEERHAVDASSLTPPPTDEQKRVNLQDLARKVYPEIIRMLNVETEWLGKRL